MAESIAKGITIVLRGETAEFDKGVSKINSELKGLKKETKLLNGELKFDPYNVEKLTQKMKLLKDQEKLLNEELDAYNQAMQKMDVNSDEFKEAEKKVRSLNVELKNVKLTIDKLGGNEVGVKLKALGNNLTKVGDNITKLGNGFKLLSGTASAMLLSYGKMSLDLSKYADDINTMAKQTGLGTDTLQAFGQMASLIDVDLNTLSKSAVYLTKNLDSKKAVNTYKQLGVAIKDANGNYRNTEDILFDTLSALQQVEDETKRSMLANDLFGKSYSELGAILNDASVDLSSIKDQVKENGVILSQDELDKLNEVNDNIDKFKMAVSGIGTSLVADFQEPIANITGKLVELAKKVKEFVGGLSTKQKESILKILGVVASISPILLVVGGAISSVGKAITNINTLMTTLGPMVSTLFTTLTTNPLAMVVVGVVALTSAVVWLYENFDEVKAKVSEVWEKFKQTEFVQNLIDIFNTLKETLDNVIESIKGVFNWIGDTIGKVGEFMNSGINKIVGWFSSGGFGNMGAYASGGYGTLELSTTINVNNNGANLSPYQAQAFGRQIVEYVNDKLGRRI